MRSKAKAAYLCIREVFAFGQFQVRVRRSRAQIAIYHTSSIPHASICSINTIHRQHHLPCSRSNICQLVPSNVPINCRTFYLYCEKASDNCDFTDIIFRLVLCYILSQLVGHMYTSDIIILGPRYNSEPSSGILTELNKIFGKRRKRELRNASRSRPSSQRTSWYVFYCIQYACSECFE